MYRYSETSALLQQIRSSNEESGQKKLMSLPEDSHVNPSVSRENEGGKEDERFLWGEFSRIIGEIRPSWVVAENVPGLLSTVSYKDQFPMDNSGNAEGEVGDLFTRTGRGVADQILEEIEALGYTVLPIVYSASAVGAPHKRERVFVVAHSASDRSTSRISGPDKREEGIARIPFHGCS